MELSGIMSAADEHDRRAAVINALHMQSPLISLADHKHHDMPRRRVIAIDLRYPRKPLRNRNLLPAEKLMILFPELFFQSLSAVGYLTAKPFLFLRGQRRYPEAQLVSVPDEQTGVAGKLRYPLDYRFRNLLPERQLSVDTAQKL